MDAKIGAVHVGAIRGDLYRFATYPGAAVGPAGAREFRFLVVGEFGRDQVEQFRRMALGTRRGIVTRVPIVVHVDGEPVRYCAGAYIAATRTTGKLGGTATVDLAFVAHEPLAVVTRATWRTRLAALNWSNAANLKKTEKK